jgi:Nif-specific regulatory protein
VLQGDGYTVLSARTVSEAVQVQQQHSGDLHLLLTDANLPDGRGEALAEQLAQSLPGLNWKSKDSPERGADMKESLIIAKGEGHPNKCELAPHQPVTLGRHRSNTVVLQDKHASRKHAELFHSNSRWFIRDCNTLNGTRVNGKRITEPQPLADGEEIGIGDTCLLFLQEASDNRISLRPPQGHGHHMEQPEPPSVEMPPTVLQVDELSALCSFMTSALEETSSRALIERALAVVHSQMGADLTGFLSLDPEEPLPRMVRPEKASVDAHLSRRLTQRVQQEGRLVRLNEEGAASDSGSLLSFRDALCVPVGGSGAPLGAIHVYKSGKLFSEREALFCEVLTGYLANSLRVLRSRRTLEAENSRLRGHAPGCDDLIGNSLALYRLRQDIARVAPHSCTVLITGESGVGKELVANALHRLSARRDGPFVPINCAAIAPAVADAELFGYREGAFTGANCDRTGFFEQADDGTIFLDEIGDLSLECQAKLLRILDGKGFRPVGAEADVHVDVRVVAATHRDLETMVHEGKFRRDLLFRFQVPVKVPPLREHIEDIPALVEHFLPALRKEYRRPLKLTEQAVRRLQAYSWPGNVRQLRTALESAVAMTDSEVVDVDDLRLPDGGPGTAPRASGGAPPTLKLEHLEAWAIRQALQRTHRHLGQAAELLGIHRDTLTSKIKKYGIDRDET